jgi:hypothetical protein
METVDTDRFNLLSLIHINKRPDKLTFIVR